MANMTYQCIYCKARYDHDQSYQHNAYQCPKQQGAKMKAGLIGLLAIAMVSVTGCDTLKNLLPQDKFPTDVDKIELALYKGEKVYRYQCLLNTETKALTDCQEVK